MVCFAIQFKIKLGRFRESLKFRNRRPNTNQYLKGQCHEIFYLYFVHDSNPSGLLMNRLNKCFRIPVRFLWDIQFLKKLPASHREVFRDIFCFLDSAFLVKIKKINQKELKIMEFLLRSQQTFSRIHRNLDPRLKKSDSRILLHVAIRLLYRKTANCVRNVFVSILFFT